MLSLSEEISNINRKVNQLVHLFLSNNNSDVINSIVNNLDSNLPRTSTSSFEVVDI